MKLSERKHRRLSAVCVYPFASPFFCSDTSNTAPTGGGKTVLFELALIMMLMTSGQDSTSKCVYVAPTKVGSVLL